MGSTAIQTTRDLFLWCMSVIYLFAFASLFVQIPGLYGENGILPAKLVLENEAESFVDLLSTQPTLLRLLPKVGLDLDTGMDFLCVGGAMLSFVAMVSRDQRNCVVFSVLWMFYLSLFQVGQAFLWFQWDVLLLEAGFLCMLLAPLNCFGYVDVASQLPHDSITFWLIKWLLFRRTFASGLSKLSTEQSSWWTLTEMNHHYETQNLPTPLAWYFHQLPVWLQRLSVVTVLTTQIPVSLFIFSPYNNQRRFVFYSQCLISTMMMLSGNYGFYTLLILTLSLSLIDDQWLQSWTANSTGDGKSHMSRAAAGDSRGLNIQKFVVCVITYSLLALSVIRAFSLHITLNPLQVSSNSAFTEKDVDYLMYWLTPLTIILAGASLLHQIKKAIMSCRIDMKKHSTQDFINVGGCVLFGFIAISLFALSLVPHTSINKDAKAHLPDQLKELHSKVSRNYQLANPYIFYSRTYDKDSVGRVEVVIEGADSRDARIWKEYNFRFKPGNTSSQLPIVSPHQPRLDYQMWFAARDGYENNHWLINLIYRLLTNQHEVLELMGDNPFPDDPPKYIRCTLYRYHFSSSDKADDRYSASSWWVREPLSEYLPILSLDEPSLKQYIKRSGLSKRSEDGARRIKPSGNLLRAGMERVRSLFGQGNGSAVCLVLVITGFLLTLLDPSINIITSVAVQPLANGHTYHTNDMKSN